MGKECVWSREETGKFEAKQIQKYSTCRTETRVFLSTSGLSKFGWLKDLVFQAIISANQKIQQSKENLLGM